MNRRYAALATCCALPLACGDPTVAAVEPGSTSSGVSGEAVTTTSSGTGGGDTDVEPTAGGSSSMGTTEPGVVTDTSTGSTSAGDEGTTGAPEPWDCVEVGGALGIIVQGEWTNEQNDIAPPRVGDCTLLPWDGVDAAYRWTAPADGWYLFTADSGYGPVQLALFDACNGPPIDCRIGNGDYDQSLATAYLVEGESVAVVLDGPPDGAPPTSFELRVDPMGECSPSTDLGDGLVAGAPGDVAGQGNDVNAICHGGQASNGEDQTFTWIAPSTGVFTIELTSESFSGGIGVWRGQCNHFPDQVVCAAGGNVIEVSFLAVGGASYSIVVDASNFAQSTAFTLGIQAASALAGDCCETDGSAGCQDAGITGCVCGIETNCCDPDHGWTPLCAGLAASRCGAACEPIVGGDCCEAHDGLSCGEPTLAACACEIHFDCCTYPFSTGWVEPCAAWVTEFCNGDCD